MSNDTRDVMTVCKDYNVTVEELNSVKTIFDDYFRKFMSGQQVERTSFSDSIGAVLPNLTGIIVTYFAENIAKAFLHEGKWTDLFWALYGDIPKYKVLKRQMDAEKK